MITGESISASPSYWLARRTSRSAELASRRRDNRGEYLCVPYPSAVFLWCARARNRLYDQRLLFVLGGGRVGLFSLSVQFLFYF